MQVPFGLWYVPFLTLFPTWRFFIYTKQVLILEKFILFTVVCAPLSVTIMKGGMVVWQVRCSDLFPQFYLYQRMQFRGQQEKNEIKSPLLAAL